jgi:hypothetical protein
MNDRHEHQENVVDNACSLLPVDSIKVWTSDENEEPNQAAAAAAAAAPPPAPPAPPAAPAAPPPHLGPAGRAAYALNNDRSLASQMDDPADVLWLHLLSYLADRIRCDADQELLAVIISHAVDSSSESAYHSVDVLWRTHLPAYLSGRLRSDRDRNLLATLISHAVSSSSLSASLSATQSRSTTQEE